MQNDTSVFNVHLTNCINSIDYTDNQAYNTAKQSHFVLFSLGISYGTITEVLNCIGIFQKTKLSTQSHSQG